MKGKNSLYSYTIRDLADSESGVCPTLAFAYDHALENLNAFFISFPNPHMDLNSVAGLEYGNIGAHLFSIEYLQNVHCVSF
jgi:hypothetical protein